MARTKLRSRFLPTLFRCEDRTVPALISWDGGAGDSLWLSKDNWSTDTLPGPADDVTIDTSTLTLNPAAVTIKSLTLLSSTQLNVAGGSLTVTNGLTTGTGAEYVNVTGAGSFAVSGPTNVDGCGFYASQAGTLTLSNLTALAASTTAEGYFQADGLNSKVSLPALTTVTGTISTQFVRLRSYNGGSVSAPLLSKIDSGYVEILSHDPGSSTDLSGLKTFELPAGGPAGYVTARLGGQINVNAALTKLDRVQLSVGETSSFPTGQLTSFKNSGIYVYGGAKPSFSSLTTLDNSDIVAYGGSTVTLPGITSIPDHPGKDVYLQAQDAGSLLSLPNLTSATANNSSTLRIRTYNGAVLSAPLLSKLENGFVEILSHDPGGLTDLSGLKSFDIPAGLAGYLSIRLGGQVKVNAAVTMLDRVQLSIGETSKFSTGGLTSFKNSWIYVYGGAAPNFAGLTTFENSDVVAYGGATVTLSGVTSIPDHPGKDVYLQAQDVGSLLSLPNLTSATANNSSTLRFRTYNGANLSAPLLSKIDTGYVEIRAQDTGSQTSLPGLTTLAYPVGTLGSIASVNGGKIAVSAALTKLPNTEFYTNTPGGFPIGQLTDLTGNITVDGADTFTFAKLANFGEGFVTSYSPGTVAAFPALTKFTSSASIFSGLRAYSGSSIVAPALTKIDTGFVELRAQDGGSQVNLGALATLTFPTGTYGNLYAFTGGKITFAPALTALANLNISTDTANALPFGQFTTITGCTVDATGGSPSYSKVTTITGGSLITAYNAGNVLAFPALVNFDCNASSFSHIRAYAGGTLSAPALTKIDSGYVEFRSQDSGSVIDLPAFATLTFPTGTFGNVYSIFGGTFNVAPALTALSVVNFRQDTTVGFPIGQLLSFADSNVDLFGGSPVFGKLTAFNRSAVTAYGPANVSFPVLTTFASNASSFARIRAYAGGSLSMPALAKIDTGYLELRSQDPGSLVSLPALNTITFPTGTFGAFNSYTGGKLEPGVGYKSLTNVDFHLDSTNGFPTAQLLSASDSNINIEGGQPVFANLATFNVGQLNSYNPGTKASYPALVNFIANTSNTSYIRAFGGSTTSAAALAKIDTGFLQFFAQDAGSVLDLPALAEITAPANTNAQGFVSGATFNTAANFKIYNAQLYFDDQTKFNWSNFTIDDFSYVNGSGKLPGNVTNKGTLRAGNNDGKTIEIGGSFTQTATGELDVYLGGAATAGTDYTLYKVGGAVALDGKLVVALFNGHQPALNNLYTVVTGASRTGNFVNYQGLDVGNNVELLPQFNPTNFALKGAVSTGPIVTGFTPTGNVFNSVTFFDVTFSEAINGASIDIGDATVTGPGGPYVPLSVNAIGGNTYRFNLPTLVQQGAYTVTVGPNITDIANNPMNQNGNGTNGEDPGDKFTGGFTIVTADLKVNSFTGVPVTGNFGLTVNLSWEVQNYGSAATSGGWFDTVFLSTDAVLDGGDIALLDKASPGLPLAPGGKYNQTASVKLPLTPANPDGTYYLIVGTDRFNQVTESDESNNALASSVTTLKTPPRVASVQTNSGAAQHSRVSNAVVTFNEPVTIAGATTAAFTVTRTGPGGPTGAVTIAGAVIDNTGPATKVTLTFSGAMYVGGSLIDGNYTVAALASKVTDATALALDGNGDGVVGDDSADVIFRLFGDADGDRDVDVGDFVAFRAAFGNGPSIFDADGDGDTDVTDFVAFRARFGTMI